ncbi:MAG: secretin N-terminal domain-containing protein [Acidobacteriota bacterium]
MTSSRLSPESSTSSNLRAALGAACLSIALVGAPPATAEAPIFEALDAAPVTYTADAAVPARDIWTAFGDRYDFDVVFSPKLRDSNLPFSVRGVSLGDALDRLALAADHFWIPLDARTVLVADDTPQQRRAYEPQAVQTIRLENLRGKDAMTALRSIYGLKHITIDEPRRTLTVRDFAEKVDLAQDLLRHLDVPEDEVTIKLQLVTVPRAAWREGETGGLEELVAARDPLLSTDLGIVGRRTAHFQTEEKLTDGEQLSVGIQLEARVHPSSEEVTLSLESNLSRKALNSDEAGESKRTASSWRVASGQTRVIELPGGLDSDGGVLALVMTPTIHSSGAAATASKVQWISASSPMTVSTDGLSEAKRAEVKKRLRQRLAELPRKQGTAKADPGSE